MTILDLSHTKAHKASGTFIYVVVMRVSITQAPPDNDERSQRILDLSPAIDAPRSHAAAPLSSVSEEDVSPATHTQHETIVALIAPLLSVY